MMTPIHEFVGQDLLWVPTATFRNQYELIAGNTVLATLDMSNWTTAAHAVTAEGHFSIRREGFFRQQVMIRATETGPVLATYTRGWTGGILQCANGRLFKWENANFWGTKRTWTDQFGTPLVQFQSSPWTRELLVRVEPEAATTSEHPLLVLLGNYITILSKRDTSNTPTNRA